MFNESGNYPCGETSVKGSTRKCLFHLQKPQSAASNSLSSLANGGLGLLLSAVSAVISLWGCVRRTVCHNSCSLNQKHLRSSRSLWVFLSQPPSSIYWLRSSQVELNVGIIAMRVSVRATFFMSGESSKSNTLPHPKPKNNLCLLKQHMVWILHYQSSREVRSGKEIWRLKRSFKKLKVLKV